MKTQLYENPVKNVQLLVKPSCLAHFELNAWRRLRILRHRELVTSKQYDAIRDAIAGLNFFANLVAYDHFEGFGVHPDGISYGLDEFLRRYPMYGRFYENLDEQYMKHYSLID